MKVTTYTNYVVLGAKNTSIFQDKFKNTHVMIVCSGDTYRYT